MEYKMSLNFMELPEFFEGVRALLIDKDGRPRWMHKDVFAVDHQKEVLPLFERDGSDIKFDIVNYYEK